MKTNAFSLIETLVVIAIVIYLTSALSLWNYFRIVHGRDGAWSHSTPDTADVFVTLIPVVNTAFSFLFWTSSPRRDGRGFYLNFNKINKIITKLFCVKK